MNYQRFFLVVCILDYMIICFECIENIPDIRLKILHLTPLSFPLQVKNT